MQRVLYAGFSTDHQSPRRDMSVLTSALNIASSTPTRSRSRARAMFTMLWRAREKTWQGVPMCTYQIHPSRRRRSIARCVLRLEDQTPRRHEFPLTARPGGPTVDKQTSNGPYHRTTHSST